jgi:putative ABC transport system permease protein
MMRYLRRAYAKFRNLFSNSRLEEDLDREIASHLALLEDEFRSNGLIPDEARLEARRAYGAVEQAKQLHRNERTYQGITQAAQDIRYAFRQLRRAPGFTAAAVLTLALGIGANTAIFSVVNAVLLKPLSYPDPDRIVQFLLTFPQGPTPAASVPDFHLWREQTRAFQYVSAYDFDPHVVNLTDGVPEQLHGLHVTADYFRLLGAPMLLGRTFTSKEDSPNAGNFAVISYGIWKRRFGGDANIVGKVISLGNEPFTIVGVASERFQTDPVADLWLPFQFDLNSSDWTHYFKVAGRLKPGIPLEQANAQLKLAANEARRIYPLADPQQGFRVQPLHDTIVSGVRPLLLMLGGAVSLVLLIACANVANLLLIRATGRKREFAIRAALGASRRRILFQLLTESILLSSAGGLLGLGLGVIGVRALLAASPGDIPRIGENGTGVGLDWRVLVFTLGLSVFSAVLFGIVPAWGASRPDLNAGLKESGNRQGAGFRQNKVRSLLVVSEVSLAIVLLLGAALLIRTFIALRQVNTGFDPHNVITMDMSLSGARFANTASVSRLVRDARQRLNAVPGVEASAMTSWPPLRGRLGLPFIVIGRPMGNSSSTGDGLWMDASPGYFEVFKIPVLRGRDFTEEDDAAAPRVVLINESMAKRYWPNQDPIGQQIIIGKGLGPKFEEPPRQIIGIVGDTRDTDLTIAPDPTMIIPEAQESDGMTAFSLQFNPVVWLVRTRLELHQMVPAVAEQLRQATGGLPVGHERTMDEVLLGSTARQDFNMLLLTIFAAAALVLAAIGIYGVLAYSIAQRTQEIGIRMALGADRTNIRNWVLRQGMLLAITGVLIGVGAAFGLTRLIAGFLFGVKTWDPVVFVAVPMLLTIVALLATWVPARRAARLDPIQSLRLE